MINLLPQDRQDVIRRQDWARVAAIIGISLCAGLAVFVLALLLVRNFYLAELNAIQVAVDAKKNEMEIFDVAKIKDQIVYNNKLIDQTKIFYSRQAKITPIIEKIAQFMPSGISLNEFVYSLGKVELSGFAAERVSLVEFKENLEMCPDFLNVDFPSKNWLMAKDIEFNINFEYGKKN